MKKNEILEKVKGTWKHYIESGLQHLIVYSLIRNHSRVEYARSAIAFNCLENMLKGYLFYLTNDYRKVQGLGHKIEEIVNECKKHDPNFLAWLNIVPESVWKRKDWSNMTEKDFIQIYIDPEFYMLLAKGVDLKYKGMDIKGDVYKVHISGSEITTLSKIIKEVLQKIPDVKTEFDFSVTNNETLNPELKYYLSQFAP